MLHELLMKRAELANGTAASERELAMLPERGTRGGDLWAHGYSTCERVGREFTEKKLTSLLLIKMKTLPKGRSDD